MRKKEIQLALFASGMMVFIENPKESTRERKRLLELICEFSKVAEYKSNTPKPIAFVNASSDQLETKIKNTLSFTIAAQTYHVLNVSLAPTLLHLLFTDLETQQTLGSEFYYSPILQMRKRSLKQVTWLG